jgi:acyl carrier protein
MNRETLRQTLAQQLKAEKVAYSGDLTDDVSLRDGLGLDSIDVVDLVINMQSKFDIELKSEDLEKITKVGDLLDLLAVKLNILPSAA